MRAHKPYLFYGQTISLCEQCLMPVPAKILIEDNDVFFQKRCRDHGVQKTLVSTDATYYKRCRDFLKPGDIPLAFQSPVESQTRPWKLHARVDDRLRHTTQTA